MRLESEGLGQATLIRAGDVTIRPARPLKRAGRTGARIFAERGSVLAHPDAIGWDTSWRHVSNTSTSTVAEWERRLHRNVREGWLATGTLIVFAVLIVVMLVSGHGYNVPVYLFGGGSMVATLRAWRRARGSQRALEAARQTVGRPSRAMRMSLKWTAGRGQGPTAVAVLYPPRGTMAPVAEVPLVNVPVGFSPPTHLPVEVRGDPTDAPVIMAGDVELWPAARAELAA